MIKETEVNAKDEVTGSIPVVGSRSDPVCTGIEPEEGSGGRVVLPRRKQLETDGFKNAGENTPSSEVPVVGSTFTAVNASILL